MKCYMVDVETNARKKQPRKEECTHIDSEELFLVPTWVCRIFNQGQFREEHSQRLLARVRLVTAVFEVGDLRQYTEMYSIVPELITQVRQCSTDENEQLRNTY